MKERKLTIDLEALGSISHTCDGCCSVETCCCAKFDICITEKEMEAIVGILPAASKYCPWLCEDGGYRNVFEETDDGLYSLDTFENGLCLFAYKSNGGIRCAVHTAAYDSDIPLEQVKPSPCILWPLALSEPDERDLSICGDALLFHCNTSCCEKTEREISPSLIEAIERIYGVKAREAMCAAADNGLRSTTLSVYR